VKPFYRRLGWAIGSLAYQDGGCTTWLEHRHSVQWHMSVPSSVHCEWVRASDGLKASAGEAVVFV
jgi:hypothetical protein